MKTRMADILDFVETRALLEEFKTKGHPYSGKQFHDKKEGASIQRRIELVKSGRDDRDSKPDAFSLEVDEKAKPEHAAQRAVLQCPCILEKLRGNVKLSWVDGELPVCLNKQSPGTKVARVDLISRLEDGSQTFAEMKYTTPGKSGTGNGPDFAIFEALIYKAAIRENVDWLVQNHVAHPNAKEWNGGSVDWQRVNESHEILVIANKSYWKNASASEHKDRILHLVEAIHSELGISVLLRQFPDFDLTQGRVVVDGCYIPRIQGVKKLNLESVF